jgi:hypothetical protein
MKATETTNDTTRLAQAILLPGTNRLAVDLLASRLAWAIRTGEIPLQRVAVPSIQRDIDGTPHPSTRYERQPTLGHAAEWAGQNGYTIRPELSETLQTTAPQQTAPPAPQWPWGQYQTPLLEILAEAVAVFCTGVEPYPKKGVVVDWIKARMAREKMPISDDLPAKMETIISPRPYVNHRTPRPKNK